MLYALYLAVVSWKIPADYTGDESYYDPSWLIAENLDQNSLAAAFKQFPMDADPDYTKLKKEEAKVNFRYPPVSNGRIYGEGIYQLHAKF